MLDELISAIDRAKQTIQEHGPSLAKSEKRTRPVLIDPILRVLGWDVADPSIVKIEYNLRTFPNQQVDYALCYDSRVVVFVEAKKLYEPLKNHAHQMVNYAVGDGIKYAVLTDGNLWEMYDVFKEIAWSEKKILSIDISSSDSVTGALNFLGLWRFNLQSSVPMLPLNPIVGKRATRQKRVEKKNNWIAIPQFRPEAGTKPSHIHFKDGPSKPISHWNEILIESVRQAISIGRLTEATVPLGLTLKRYYLHTRPNHPDGTPFHQPRYIKNTKFVIEAHGNISTMVKRVTHLWNHLGLPISDVFVEQIPQHSTTSVRLNS